MWLARSIEHSIAAMKLYRMLDAMSLSLSTSERCFPASLSSSPACHLESVQESAYALGIHHVRASPARLDHAPELPDKLLYRRWLRSWTPFVSSCLAGRRSAACYGCLERREP